jgi:hypothetical protein
VGNGFEGFARKAVWDLGTGTAGQGLTHLEKTAGLAWVSTW